MRSIELQMDRIYMDFEEKIWVDIVQVFRLLVRNLSRFEVAEGEKAVHNRVKVFYLNAVLVDSSLLVMAEKTRELANNSIASCTSTLPFTLESPMT